MIGIYDGMTKEMLEAFRKYHRENPWVFDEFVKEAFALKQAGRIAFGAKEIFERMRWQRMEFNSLADYKINNTWAPYYARALIKKYPVFRNYIMLKKLNGGSDDNS